MSRNYHALIQAGRAMEEEVAPAQAPSLPDAVAASKASSSIPETPVVSSDLVAAPALAVATAPTTAVEAAAVEPVVAQQPDIWTIHLPELREPERHEIPAGARAFLDKAARILPNSTTEVIVEHYRRLRTKIIQQHAAKPFRTVVVSSANPKEGKTVTVLNLALAFAMLPGFRVLVVDCDLRRQSLSDWTGLRGQPGLSNLIEGSAPFTSAIHPCGDLSLQVMPAGTSEAPAGELLHSSQLGEKIAEAAAKFDLVFIDTPPVNLLSDAQVLAEHCDAVLLVVRAFFTTQKALEKAAAEVNRFRVIGTVLNGGPRTRLYGYGYGGYYTSSSGKK